MQFAEVAEVLDELENLEVSYWVSGGWGVAALRGTQSREHRDLDLAVDAADLDRCLEVLVELGYLREVDWLPVRVEFGKVSGGHVDVHPVVFDAHGNGRQQDLGGGHFEYPHTAFTTGAIEGRSIPCLSIAQQRSFHSGYALRPQDVHDLAQLDIADSSRG